MKKIIIIMLLIQNVIFAQELLLNDWGRDLYVDRYIQFQNGILTYTPHPEESLTKQKTSYSERTINNITFIHLNYPGGWFSKNSDAPAGDNDWAIIYHDWFIFAYHSDNSPPIDGGFAGMEIFYLNDEPPIIRASSELTENTSKGQIIYSAENLSNFTLGNPWVEGVDGYGIGEYITITELRKNIETLFISNGFVSYERPELYNWNSRIKEISITSMNNNEEFFYTLEDHPNFQRIEIPENIQSDSLKIEILSVYEGERWMDTCLNFIATDGSYKK